MPRARVLFRWAIESDIAPHDPPRDIEPIPSPTSGHHTWSLDEIAACESRHPLGIKGGAGDGSPIIHGLQQSRRCTLRSPTLAKRTATISPSKQRRPKSDRY